MIDDLGRQRQRLAESYAEKYDMELLELAADPDSLTEIARDTLRDELRKRGLGEPGAASAAPPRSPSAAIHDDTPGNNLDFLYRAPGPLTASEEDGASHDYTWKTRLCDCDTREQALQLTEALHRAGIESWIEGPGNLVGTMDLASPRILVAADQLQAAEAVAAQPIPQDIVEQVRQELMAPSEAYTMPVCPRCGAPDPVLCPEDEDHAAERPAGEADLLLNRWQCEACGAEWTDGEEPPAGAPQP